MVPVKGASIFNCSINLLAGGEQMDFDFRLVVVLLPLLIAGGWALFNVGVELHLADTKSDVRSVGLKSRRRLKLIKTCSSPM
jgi:hypothetical protein